MNKKIFDILPPKPPTTFREERPKPPLEKNISSPLFVKKKWYQVIFALFIFILAGIFCYFTLSKAEIEIWPESDFSTFKTKITGDATVEETDPALWVKSGVIPVKIFEAEKTITEEFPSSGKILKEKKAEGIIRVYNNYSTSPQVLVATTRFVSADGKLFRSIEKVTIPGGKYEEGKFVPGYLDIKVRAAEPGVEYNIGPTTFSIPGFAGTALYTKFYGKSFVSMKGGEIKEVPQVTQKDLDQTKEILTKKAKEECEATLKDKISSDASLFALLKEALETRILETTPLAQAGQDLEKFTFQVKAQSKALVFKPKDIENFAIDFISSQIPPEKRVLVESLKTNYSSGNINFSPGKITLSLEMTAKIFSDIDEISLKKGLVGKSLTETNIFLKNLPQITKAKVRLWPFWVKKIPEDLRKIEIKLNIE